MEINELIQYINGCEIISKRYTERVNHAKIALRTNSDPTVEANINKIQQEALKYDMLRDIAVKELANNPKFVEISNNLMNINNKDIKPDIQMR